MTPYPGWARFGTTLPERQVAAIAEIGRTIVSGHDYGQVLAEVIAKVGRILDAESGGFMLYDDDRGELVLQRPAFGMDSDELIKAYRVPLSGGGNAVTVFVSGQPYFTNDARNDPRVLRRFVDLYNATRILSVPLQIEGRSMGVFHAINKRSGDFLPEDVELALLLAPQLAVIIQSAAMMRELRSHEMQLERIINIHNSLTNMVLTGRDVRDLADRLAELIDLPIAVADGSGRIVFGASSKVPAAERLVLDEMQNVLDGHSRGRHTDLEPILVSLPVGELLVVPILIGPRLLGGVGAWGSADRLDDLTRRTLQQAALVFAVELLKEAEVYEVERRLQSDAMEHLLLTDDAQDASNLLRRLEVDASRLRGARLVVDRSTPSATQPAGSREPIDRIYRVLRSLLPRGWPGAVAVAERGGIALILPVVDSAAVDIDARRLDRILSDLVAQAKLPGFIAPFVGVGRPVDRGVDLRQSFGEASTVIAARRLVDHDRRVVFLEQLGLLGLLAHPADSSDVERFVHERIGPLLDYDREHKSDWTGFARALVASNFSVKKASRRLGLHFNTARYRAARMEELLSIHLSSAQDRLDLQLALHLLDLRTTLRPL